MKLIILLLTTLNLLPILKGMIVVSILSSCIAILRIIPHFVTKNLQSMVMMENKFLIILILMKITKSAEGLSIKSKTLLDLLLIILMIFLYLFIIYLFGKMIAFKYMKANNLITKIMKLSFFQKFLNGK